MFQKISTLCLDHESELLVSSSLTQNVRLVMHVCTPSLRAMSNLAFPVTGALVTGTMTKLMHTPSADLAPTMHASAGKCSLPQGSRSWCHPEYDM